MRFIGSVKCQHSCSRRLIISTTTSQENHIIDGVSRPSTTGASVTCLCYISLPQCGLLRHNHKERHHKQMAHVLWQQRCLEVASRRHHVGVVDETRRTYRHHGRQRDAPRRIATFRHATLRVATHRYATLEPLGKPGGSRAFIARGSATPAAASRRLRPRKSDNEGAS